MEQKKQSKCKECTSKVVANSKFYDNIRKTKYYVCVYRPDHKMKKWSFPNWCPKFNRNLDK